LDDFSDKEGKAFLNGEGCPCCFDTPAKDVHNRAPESSYYQSELMAVLGDDIDGLAATMEDFGLI